MPKKTRTQPKGPAGNRARTDKAAFDAAHQKGMAALKRGDYDTLGDAIEDERAIIQRQAPKWKRRSRG